MSAKKKSVFGTKEWASHNVNCTVGCSHDCRYCYAKYNAVKRFKNVKTEDWVKETPIDGATTRTYKKFDGTVMFPTQHDISPDNLMDCIYTLKELLKAGNTVLIVMKPHYSCLHTICKCFEEYKDKILFRFTVCASDNAILKYWEPGAPPFEERMMSLRHAFEQGFQTSISMEPCLDWPNVVKNFYLMAPYVTNSIWIGTMNFINERVEVNTKKDAEMVAQMKGWMTQKTFEDVYEELKDHPLIKWKESVNHQMTKDH